MNLKTSQLAGRLTIWLQVFKALGRGFEQGTPPSGQRGDLNLGPMD